MTKIMTKIKKIKSLFLITKYEIIFILSNIIFFVILDLISKYFAFKAKLAAYYIIPVLNFLKVKNYGMSFGLLSGHPNVAIYFIIILNIFVIFYLLNCLRAKHTYKYSYFFVFSICLILSGAIGNLFDRFYYGYVRDFIDFHIKEYHWPCFNIADMCICIGAAMFAYCEIFLKKKLPCKQKH